MTEQTQTQAAGRAAANGQAAAVPPGTEPPYPTGGERALAVLGLLFAGLLAVMALDVLTGGAVSRLIPQRGTDG